jgi:hypothetical protein
MRKSLDVMRSQNLKASGTPTAVEFIFDRCRRGRIMAQIKVTGSSYFEAYAKVKAALKPDEMSDFLQLR